MFKSEKIVRQIPSLISMIRILLAPVFSQSIKRGQFGKALLVTSLAGASDFADGFLARKFSWISKFGALLDPIADKVFELTAVFWLHKAALLPSWYKLIFFSRNILQLCSIPLLTIVFPREFKVKPKLPAKMATAIGFTLISLSLVRKKYATNPLLRVLSLTIIFVSGCLEIQILATYLPRLVAIILRQHDTFE